LPWILSLHFKYCTHTFMALLVSPFFPELIIIIYLFCHNSLQVDSLQSEIYFDLYSHTPVWNPQIVGHIHVKLLTFLCYLFDHMYFINFWSPGCKVWLIFSYYLCEKTLFRLICPIWGYDIQSIKNGLFCKFLKICVYLRDLHGRQKIIGKPTSVSNLKLYLEILFELFFSETNMFDKTCWIVL